MDVADGLIEFIEGLIVPSGRRQGEPMVVLPFQRRFLRELSGNQTTPRSRSPGERARRR